MLATSGHTVAGAVAAPEVGRRTAWFDAVARTDGSVVLVVGESDGREDPTELRASILALCAAEATPSDVFSAFEHPVGDELLIALFDPGTGALTYATTAPHGPVLAVPAGPAAMVPAGWEASAGIGLRHGEMTLPPLAVVALSTTSPIIEGVMRSEWSAGGGVTAAWLAARIAESLPSQADCAAAVVLAMGSGSPDRFACSLPAVPFTAPFVRASLRAFVHGLGLNDDRMFALQTAVGEAVANSIEHAYGQHSARVGAVRVSAERSFGDVTVLVEDDGEWRLDSDPCDTRGRGLPLMRALVDVVDIVSDGRSTTVRLTLRGGGGSA